MLTVWVGIGVILSTLYIFIDRVSGRLDLNGDLVLPLLWNALFASAFLYDRASPGRAHGITVVSYAFFWLAWVTAALV